MFKKFRLKSLLLLALSLVMLTGCGGGQKSGKGNEGGSEDDAFTLTVWVHPYVGSDAKEAQNKVFEDMAVEFKETYPNANVVFEEIPWANREEKMLAALSTDEGPDVFYLIPDMMTQFAEKGVLAPLDESLGKDFDYSDFTETSIEAVTYNDHIYGLPILREVQTMFYNTTILEEIGGDPENLPTTWAEFNELADKAVEKGYYARTFEGANTLNATLYPYIWQAGGDIIGEDEEILINSDESVKGWEEIMRQYKAGYFPEDSITAADQAPLFVEGKSLATFSSAYILNLLKDAGVENYAIGQPLEGVTFGTTGMFVVSAKSKNVDKASEFVATMTNADNQRAFNTLTNYIPSRESAIDIYDGNPDMKQLAEYVGMAKGGVIHPAARVFMANVQAKVQAMMEGSLTPKAAADEAADMIKNEM